MREMFSPRLIRRTTATAALALLACLPAVAQAGKPTDRLFADQWALQAGEPLDVASAWEIADGAGTVVAVIDSGADLTHPDLRDSLWTNPGEIAGNGIDDDHDGWVDDVHGIDLIDHDGEPTDQDGHGTHVAGIIAAARNGSGVVGVAPAAKLMIIRALDAANAGTTSDVITGIQYAVAHGANVINMSVNGDASDENLRDAIAAAGAAGVTVVVSAGNSGRNITQIPSYPASYVNPDLLSVAAADVGGLLATFSNFGSIVSLAAPGVDILSTAMGGDYELRSGTSMAAPETTGAIALLHSARPDLGPAELRSTLISTSTHEPGLAGLLGAGEVNIVAALRSVVPESRWAPPVLTGRLKQRSKARPRALVTWSLGGNDGSVASFRVSVGHKTLARKPAQSRGAWLRKRHGNVRLTALDSTGRALASVIVKLG
jgi:subtilisin family serine protease